MSNGKIFDDPVFNYTRDFPYLWEEITLPIAYKADRAAAESVLLAAAGAHAVVDDPRAEAALHWLQAHYALSDASLEPAVYWRITDNWLELSLRFLVEHRGVRQFKDRMTRDILTGLDRAGISVASTTYEVVGLPCRSGETTDHRVSQPAPAEVSDTEKPSSSPEW